MTRLGLVASALLWASACAGILGIEDAVCDPDVDPACEPGGGGQDAGPVVFTSLDELCDEYCSRVGQACTEEDGAQQYETPEACDAICRRGMELGAPGDSRERNDTAYCRYENALTAGTFGEIDFDCAAAGFGANGACGAPCEVYCDALAGVCGDEPVVEDMEIVHDHAACIAACEALPRTEDPFDFEVASGNTLECRLWHIQAAFGLSSTHCPHAVGAAPCAE